MIDFTNVDLPDPDSAVKNSASKWGINHLRKKMIGCFHQFGKEIFYLLKRSTAREVKFRQDFY